MTVSALLLLVSACSSSSQEADGGSDGSSSSAAPAAEDQPGSSADGSADDDQESTSPDDRDQDGGDQDSDGQEGQDRQDGDGADGETGVEPPSITGEELAERLSELGGTLAVGNAQELSLVSPDGSGALLIDGSESVLASQPTWSRDGDRLAWSSLSAERQVVLIQDYDQDGAPVGGPLVSNAAGNPVFYLQWNGSDDRLAYIRNAAAGGRVEVGTIEPGSPVSPEGQGAPFFISWAPEADRIAAHVNERSIDLYQQDGQGQGAPGSADGFESVLDVTGGFSAPAWTSDERVVVVVDDALAHLDLGTGQTEAITDVPGSIRFVLSPDRTKLAYQTVRGVEEPTLIATGVQQSSESNLVVLDLSTGEEMLVTNELVVAWEWSPDSDKLAWLKAEVRGGRASGSWSFWSAAGPLPTSETPIFNISGKYGRNYLPFFAQYAQSVTGWSPDSSAYSFAGALRGDGGVWVQLVTERVDPQLVAAGDFVTWGPADIPLPSVGPSAA